MDNQRSRSRRAKAEAEAEAVPTLADAGFAHQAPPPAEEPKDEVAPQPPPPPVAAPEKASAEEAEKQPECDTSSAPPPPQQEKALVEPRTIGGSKEVSGKDSSCFECNICLELTNDPVVTLCGHLYCWPCIYEWLDVKTSSLDADEQPQNVCPIYKAKISISSLVLLYGRGTSSSESKSKKPNSGVVPCRQWWTQKF
ncbi:hypothetical protein QYF36_026437 [Acer negundo]|nr:hypothetical protein QYF36_026437 [Acer negundo]